MSEHRLSIHIMHSCCCLPTLYFPVLTSQEASFYLFICCLLCSLYSAHQELLMCFFFLFFCPLCSMIDDSGSGVISDSVNAFGITDQSENVVEVELMFTSFRQIFLQRYHRGWTHVASRLMSWCRTSERPTVSNSALKHNHLIYIIFLKTQYKVFTVNIDWLLNLGPLTRSIRKRWMLTADIFEELFSNLVVLLPPLLVLDSHSNWILVQITVMPIDKGKCQHS